MQNLNYGVIGNCSTAALISEKGAIEWLCFPEFDSPSVFAAILDRQKGGHFGFKVTSDYKVTQSYVPHTNILSTHFESEEEPSTWWISCLAILPPMERISIVRQKFTGISVGRKAVPV